MMTLLIEYPHNMDIRSHGLPMSESVNTSESMVFTFKSKDLYWAYVNELCELVDDLEHTRFFKHKHDVLDKIRVSKLLLGRLIDFSLPV